MVAEGSVQKMKAHGRFKFYLSVPSLVLASTEPLASEAPKADAPNAE